LPALLVACAESGRYDRLEPVLAKMDAAGTPPDHVTYRFLARFCQRHGHLELGYKTLQHMLQRFVVAELVRVNAGSRCETTM